MRRAGQALKRAAAAGGEVRLIGGQWKRSKLPVADRPGLRPTPDLTGWTVLDAFAGTGALGFEAASRGAKAVVMIEADAGLVRSLGDAGQRLRATQVQVFRADALQWMDRAAGAGDSSLFDLILLDPPFAADVFEAAWHRALPLLRPGGWLYLEAPAQSTLQAPNIELHRHLKAGAVHAHLWKCSKAHAT